MKQKHLIVLLVLWCFAVFAAPVFATVNSPTTWTQVTLTSNPQTITVPFVFQGLTDLLVLDSKASPPVVLTQNSDYTVSGGAGSTGTVTTIAGGANAVQVGDTITVSRAVPLTQLTNFSQSGPLTANMIMSALDKLTMIAQQSNLLSLNSLQFQGDEVISGVMPKAVRENTLLGFNAAGGLEYYAPSTVVAGIQGEGTMAVLNTGDIPISTATETIITFQGTQYDDLGQFNSTYIGIPGSAAVRRVRVSCNLRWDSNTNGIREVKIKDNNGFTWARAYNTAIVSPNGSLGTASSCITDVIDVIVGSPSNPPLTYFYVTVYQNSGSTAYIRGNTCFFSVEYVK